MKKILTMTVGLLTAIALLAVVAAAQDGGAEAPAPTAPAAGQPAAPDGEAAGGDAEGGEADRCEPEDGAAALLGELAEEGVINQEQIPGIIQWMKTQEPNLDNYDNPADLLNAAAADGVITQTQADDIANLIEQMKAEAEGEGDEEDEAAALLGELAEEGLINQEQIPGIIQWMKTQEPNLDNYDNPADLLNAAAADGVITQTQADDIANLIEQMKTEMEAEADECPTGEEMAHVLLEELAEEGAINQRQIPGVIQWMKTQGTDLETYDRPADLLNAAAADGVITQTQADDIANLIDRMEQAERGSAMS